MEVWRSPLQAIVAALPEADDAFAPRIQVGRAPAGTFSLAELAAGEHLHELLAAEMRSVSGADHKLAAAYLIGRLSWCLSSVLAGLALRGAWAIELTASGITPLSRQVAWEEDGESGVSNVADFVLDPDLLRFSEADQPGCDLLFQSAFEVLLAPIVDSPHRRSHLPRSALWRLVGDGLAAAFLAQGKALGCADRAMSLALGMLRRKGTPLYSKQTGFIQITVPERPHLAEWFRARGGCCRYYTSDGGEYCSTCVLRDDDSRNQRLVDYLRRTHAEQAA